MIEFSLQKTRHGANGQLRLDVAATLAAGSFTVLSGASGAGKTTLLRLLAGLEAADGGWLRVNGADWLRGGHSLPVQQRRIGMVFQDYALFPHLSVADNIAFGAARGERALVQELLELCGLAALARQHPAQLSGGQKQRVALARALAMRPTLLLLDEPLSALDHGLRRELQRMLRDMHQRFALTTVMVSHDLGEIFAVADQVLQLEHGRISAQGTPAQVFLQTPRDSSRVALHGEVLACQPADVMWRVTVLVAGELVEVLLSAQDAATLSAGQRIRLSAGALQPG